MGRLVKQKQNLSTKEQELLDTMPTIDTISEYEGVKMVFKTRKESEEFLCEKADEFLQTYFNMNLEIPIKINPRMSSNLGLFHFKCSKGKRIPSNMIPSRISISHRFFDYEQIDMRKTMSILFHECVHYALCAKKLKHADADTIFDFILKKLRIETNYESIYPQVIMDFDLYTCSCKDFKGVFFGRKQPVSSVYNVCEKCKEHPKFVRKEIGTYSEIASKFSTELNELKKDTKIGMGAE